MQIEHIIQEFKSALKELYGQRLKKVILFGSWARGDATKDSDIDLLIVLDGETLPGREIDRMIEAITETNLKYNILISVIPVSELNYQQVQSPLMMNVRKEGVLA